MLLAAGLPGCSDNPVGPTNEVAYEITAALWLFDLTDPQVDGPDVIVEIKRLDRDDPAPTAVTVTMNGDTPIDLHANGDDIAVGQLDVDYLPGAAYALAFSAGTRTAACTLMTPTVLSTLAISTPTDSSTFAAGDPLHVEWAYTGTTPDEYSVSLVGCPASGYPDGIAFHSVLDGDVSQGDVPAASTLGLSACGSTYLEVIARLRDSVEGALATPESRCYVSLDNAYVHLLPVSGPNLLTGRIQLIASLADAAGTPIGTRPFDHLEGVPVLLRRGSTTVANTLTADGAFSFHVSDGTYSISTSAGLAGPSAFLEASVAGSALDLGAALILLSAEAGGYPSPFGTFAAIMYEVANAGLTIVRVETVALETVRILVDSAQPAGSHQVLWDGLDDDGHSVPDGPYWVKVITAGEESARLIVKDTAANGAELHVYSTTDIDGNVRKLQALGDILYGAAEGDGLLLWDVSNPAAPQLLASALLPDNAYHVAVRNDRAYVATHGSQGMHVVDVSNPMLPTSWPGPVLPDSSVEHIAVHGDLGLAAMYNGGVVALGLADPDAPTVAGSVSLPEHTYDARFVPDCADGALAVAGGGDALYSIDLSNPTAPAVLDMLALADSPYGLFVDGTRIYVANRYAGLTVVEVTCGGGLTLLGSVGIAGDARDVVVVGDRAYVASSEGAGLRVIDASNPTSMQVIQELPLGSSKGVAASADRIYLGGGSISILGYD